MSEIGAVENRSGESGNEEFETGKISEGLQNGVEEFHRGVDLLNSGWTRVVKASCLVLSGLEFRWGDKHVFSGDLGRAIFRSHFRDEIDREEMELAPTNNGQRCEDRERNGFGIFLVGQSEAFLSTRSLSKGQNENAGVELVIGGHMKEEIQNLVQAKTLRVLIDYDQSVKPIAKSMETVLSMIRLVDRICLDIQELGDELANRQDRVAGFVNRIVLEMGRIEDGLRVNVHTGVARPVENLTESFLNEIPNSVVLTPDQVNRYKAGGETKQKLLLELARERCLGTTETDNSDPDSEPVLISQAVNIISRRLTRFSSR